MSEQPKLSDRQRIDVLLDEIIRMRELLTVSQDAMKIAMLGHPEVTWALNQPAQLIRLFIGDGASDAVPSPR